MATVTFLLTDIERSTGRWEREPEGMLAALEEHDALLEREITRSGGTIFKHTGDGCLAVFTDAAPAVEAAVAVQRRFSAGEGAGLRIRAVVYTGHAEARGDDWFGPALNRGTRILGASHAGQVVVSDATAAVIGGDGPLVDLGVHALRDVARPERLWQAVADGLVRDFPPLRTEERRGNLPSIRTSLVGRGDAVAALEERLRATRLLTLTGVGGAGKTRLAVAVAHESAHAFVDGAWFVDLAPVAEESSVALAFVDGLGIPSVTNAGADVIAYLAGKQALVVVDNCEHVVDTTASLLDEILSSAPSVTILATSREPLGVEGEQIWRVASLDPEGAAVELFAERARAVRTDFAADGSHRSTVVQICRRLDGIPLAIELAAAQTAAFDPEQIAEMLDERFTLLTGGRRRGRQATLAAAMDWSYDLLTVDQRESLRRAAVLPGSFSPDAFAAVAAIPREAALAMLRSLVSKSLVEPATAGRFRILETVRLYGESRLVDAGEAPETRDRLVVWIRGQLDQTDDTARMDLAVEEIESVRAAIGWAEARGNVREIAAFAPLAGGALLQMMMLDDVARIVDAAEQIDDALEFENRVLWRALRGGSLGSALLDESGWRWLEAALALDPTLTTPGGALAGVLYAIYLNVVDPPRARQLMEQGLAFPDSMPLLMRVQFRVYDGIFDLTDGNYLQAVDKLERVVVAAEKAGAWWQAHLARVAEATALDLAGDHLGGRAKALESLDHDLPVGWINESIALQALAVPTVRLGDGDGGRRLVLAMLTLGRDRYAHIPTAVGPAVVTAGVLLAEQGHVEQALEVFSGAQHTLLAMRSEMAWATTKHEIARLRSSIGPAARAPLRRGREHTIATLANIADTVARQHEPRPLSSDA